MNPNLDPKPETLRRREERKGGGFLSGLLSKLGLGGEGGVSAGAGAGVGSGLWATKAGVVAMVLAGTTLAAGIGILSTSNPAVRRTAFGSGSVFSSAKGQDGASSDGLQGAGLQASKDGASTSLEYFSKANPAPSDAGAQEAGASDQNPADASAAGADAGADSAHDAAAGSAGSAAPAAKPQMVKSQGLGGQSSGGAGPRLEAQAGMAKGVGGDFQSTYKGAVKGAGSSAANRTRMGASRMSSIRSPGGNAARQLRDTSKVVKGNLRSPQMSSPGSGLTYDGGAAQVGAAGGLAAGPAAGGTGIDGAGVSNGNPNANSVQQTKEVQPPTPKAGETEEKTPYKNLIYAAIGALLVSMLLLFWASKIGDAAKIAVGPAQLALLAKAKMVSMLAAAAAAFAALMGIMLITQYDQMMQGMMFTMAGGIITAKAAMAAFDSTASERAKADIDATNQAQVAQMNQSLAAGAKPISIVSTDYGTGAFTTDLGKTFIPTYPGAAASTAAGTAGAGGEAISGVTFAELAAPK
ncbi:MAG: hypothetical protein WCU88_04040 [Elusimicrobiota bacterium]|jgi:hypothetical protein